MKKYLQNRKLTEIICDNCKENCLKPISEVNRNNKLNRKLFCSRNCSVTFNNKSGTRNTENRFDISKKAGNRNDGFTNFRYLYRSAKRRYKEFDLTLQDLKDQWDKQNGKCPYTGFQMIPRTYTKTPIDKMRQASLDRIDSSKGYVVGNIEFVCCAINYLKSDFSQQEVVDFLNDFKSSDFSEDRTISSSD